MGIPTFQDIQNAAASNPIASGVAGGLMTPFAANGFQTPNLGSNFSAQIMPLNNPVSQADLNIAGNNVQANLGQNQGLYQGMQGVGAATQQQGLQGQMNVLGQQQMLANQLGMQAMGYGPNPAQQQLAMNTGQNIAAQNALMAGQRGAGANVGLMARQAAGQGANIQQQAIGQAGVMGAQQQLAAQQALAQQQQAMSQGYVNITGAGLNQQGQQITQLGNMTNASLGNQGQLLGGYGQYNSTMAGQQGSANAANAQTGMANAQMQGSIVGGALQGLGSLGAKAVGAYDGGLATIAGIYHPGGPQKMACGGMAKGQSMKSGGTVPGKPKVGGAVDTPKNDTVPAKLSPGEIVIPRSIVEGKNPGENARKFVEKILADKGKKTTGKEYNDFKTALQNSINKRKAK